MSACSFVTTHENALRLDSRDARWRSPPRGGAQHVDTATVADPRTADSLVFERTACFGIVPHLPVRISRDGSVLLALAGAAAPTAP